MLAIIAFALVIAAGVVVARSRLSPSPFRRFISMPWGSLAKAPAFLDPVLNSNDGLDKLAAYTKTPAEIAKVSPAHLAMIHNRDRLTRPLASALIDMAIREVITIQWRTDTEEFWLLKRGNAKADAITKADRALISKLFPNEATELVIDWRNGDILGAARRLLDKVYVPKSVAYRLGLGMPYGPALLGALFLAILFMVGTSEAGFISLLMPILMVAWPSLCFWSAGETLRARQLMQEVKADRFQARMLIFAAVTIGIIASMIITLLVMLIAFGVVRSVLLILLGVMVAFALAWLRPPNKVGKPHQLAAALTYSLFNRQHSETNALDAEEKLDWHALAAAYAVGAEEFWRGTGQLKVDIGDGDDEDMPATTNGGDINPDNIEIAAPPCLDFGKQNNSLLAIHNLLAHGLLYDLWVALYLNHLTNLKADIAEHKKLTVKG